MTTAVERHLAPSQLSSDSEGSTSEEETGRFKIKSAVVQATKKDSHSPSSSLSRTPSPLPHATFSAVPPLHRGPSPSSPQRPGRRRDGSRSPSPPSRRYGRRRSRSYSPRDRRESPRWDRRGRRDRARTPSPRRKERVALEEGEVSETEEPPPKKKKEELDPILTRTGGAYIPPAKLRMMQSQIQDKSSVAYQRLAWEALKKSINGLINKVNVSNIGNIVQELFQENVVRGRGLLIRSVIQAQAASHTFTHVYAALVAIINTKFPQIGELLAKRLILQFRKGFRRNDKSLCVTAAKFLAHLVNQLVLHEIVALELLTLLLEEPTDDSVEVAVGFLKESGAKLTDISPRGVHAVFETLRSVLHSGQVTSRVQYMIEVMFAVRKDKFQEHPAVIETLSLVEEDDQITHLLSLGDDHEADEILNVFQADDDYLANEEKYKEIKAEILGEESSDSEGSSGDESDEEDSDDEEEEETTKIDIMDKTDAKALTLRRTIYLTIMSSLDYEECAHKLMKTKEDGQEPEIAMMLVECCSQERSYLRFYGLLGQRFCLLNKVWVEAFDSLFQEQYATVHRLETNKLRNVAKFFAQLYYSDALPWTGMYCIHLNEEETNSSSRIFVKILFQELAEFMGMAKLNDRLRDPILSEAFEGILPRDNPKNTRFAINFFTSIGLGGLTDDLREHLKDVQKQIMAQKQEVSSSDTSDSDSSENDSPEEEEEESSSEESSESESSSTDSEEERKRQRRARKKRKEKEGERSHGRDRGDDRKERGDDSEKRRDDKKKSGEDREKRRGDKEKSGEDRENRRDDKEKSGEDRENRRDDRKERGERGQREERKEKQRGRTKKHGSGSDKEDEWHGENRKKKDGDGSRERDREQSRKEESHSKRRDKKRSSRERKRESEDEETKRRHKGRRRDKREDRNESEEEEDDVRDERKEIRERRGRDQEEGAWERGRRRQGEGRKRDREDRREREGRGDRDSHSPRDKRRR